MPSDIVQTLTDSGDTRPLLQYPRIDGCQNLLRLLYLLDGQELSVVELASVKLQLPQSTISRHLKRLLDARWVVRRT